MLQMIAGLAIMVQSYVVLEEDNKRLNSNRAVFDWLVKVLNKEINTDDNAQDNNVYNELEVVQVESVCFISAAFS